MVIRDLNPSITTLSVPFLRFGRIKFGGRATIGISSSHSFSTVHYPNKPTVKLQSGSLAIFSPVALTPTVRSKLTSLSPSPPTTYLIAPDMEHHIFVSPWAKEYPLAEVIGMEGLPEKREGDDANKGVKFAHVFSAGNKRDMRISPEFDEEFEYEFVHSHQNKELVFLHKPTKTLIEADLLFNMPPTEQYSRTGVAPDAGIFSKFFGAMLNTHGDMRWQKRFLWYGPGGKDRTGLAESAKRINSWDFDRIIPCHGDVIETGGKSILQNLTSWFVEGKK